MSDVQKIILIALAVAGLIFLLVGFVLMHHIGGFMRTVEEEAREEEARNAASKQTPSDGESNNFE